MSKFVKELIVEGYIKIAEIFSLLADLFTTFTSEEDWENPNKETWQIKLTNFFYNIYKHLIFQSIALNDKWKLDIWIKLQDN